MWERAAPLLVFQAYLTASVLAFAFGPLDLPIQNSWKLYPYVFCGQLAIFLGYYTGMHRPSRRFTNAVSIDSAWKLSIAVTLVLLPVTIRYRNYGGLSIMDALADPAAAYSARLEHFDGDADAKWLSILRGTLAPVMSMYVPLGIVYWNRLSRIWQAAWAAGLAGVISTSLLSGAAIGLFDIVLTTPWMLWLHFRQRRQNEFVTATPAAARGSRGIQAIRAAVPTSMFRFRQKVTVGLMTVVVVSAGIHYFSYSRQSRYGMQGNEYPRDTTGWSRHMYGVTIPESVEYPLYMLTKYWTQGYQGLSECLDLPFVWCWGVGHSPFWTRYADRLNLDQWFWNNCYPMRLDAATGYSAANNWHTIYPWLASDLTFPGAIVFVGCLAYLLSRAWTESLAGDNPFAVGFVAQLLILFFYIPANNGRLSYPEETLAFWGLMLLWLMTRQGPSKMRHALIR